jgi:hypothetical protein
MYFYSFGVIGQSAIGSSATLSATISTGSVTTASILDISALDLVATINTSSISTGTLINIGNPYISATISTDSTTSSTQLVDTGAPSSIEWSDGVDTFRLDIRLDALLLDKVLTPPGFSGTEDVHWENIWEQ